TRADSPRQTAVIAACVADATMRATIPHGSTVARRPRGVQLALWRWARVEDLEDLAGAVAGDLHELGGERDRLVPRADLDEREPVDQLLGLGERTIGHAHLAALAAQLDPARRADQTADHHDDAGLDVLLGERAQLGELRRRRGRGIGLLCVGHQELHGRSPWQDDQRTGPTAARTRASRRYSPPHRRIATKIGNTVWLSRGSPIRAWTAT